MATLRSKVVVSIGGGVSGDGEADGDGGEGGDIGGRIVCPYPAIECWVVPRSLSRASPSEYE